MIDYDLIEVNEGKCWSLKARTFVDNAIEEHQIGKLSPRAFCPYDSSKEPEPKYFREILENSLGEDDLARFCKDFLGLLNYNKKGHKDRVPCLVGDADSGKTSLFFPILGLIHHGNVATVTKQRAFNKAMINPFTEVIFLDEATEKTLDIDDWKTLTQGGYAAYDVKYQTARSFINRCPMLITSQRKLDFGPVDQPAMDRRLTTYLFKALPDPNNRAAAWLKRNPMDCVVWAARKAEESAHGYRSPQQNAEDVIQEGEWDGVLHESEKEDIRSLSLIDVLDDGASAPGSGAGSSSQDVSETQSSSSPPADRVEALEDVLRHTRPESLRHRQVCHMLAAEKERCERRERARQRQYEERKAHLRERGVQSQNLDLLPVDPREPIPPEIEDDLQRDEDARKVAEQEARRKAARSAFENPWLRETEKELEECASKLDAARDRSRRLDLEAYIELLCDKLKQHHQSLGTLKTTEALAERKKLCVSLGLLRVKDQHMLKSLSEPLPRRVQAQVEDSGQELNRTEDSSEEDETMFITPTPSQGNLGRRSASAISDDLVVSREPMQQSCGRRRKRGVSESQGQAKKPRSTILNYFSSQRQ